MISILWFFLPGILALGILTSYTDIRFGKIKNWAIVGAIVYAIIAYTVVALLGYDVFSVDLFTNAGFALLVGAGFWLLGLWSAADGKLFLAFSLLLPLSQYRLGYESFFPSVTLLLNTFIPCFILFVILALFRGSLREKIKIVKQIKPNQLVLAVLFVFAVQWLSNLLVRQLHISSSLLLGLVMFLILAALLQKLLGKYFNYVILALAVLRLVLEWKYVFTADFLLNFVVYIAVYTAVFSVISNIGVSTLIRKVSIRSLKKGDVLGSIITKQGKSYAQQPASSLFRSGSKPLVSLSPEGLSEQEIARIKRFGLKEVLVQDTVPFSPLIFLGVILTLISQGNIAYFVYLFLR